MAEQADAARWRASRLVSVQTYYGENGETLGLDLQVMSGDVFRLSVPREHLRSLRRLIDDAEAILDRNARTAGQARG